MENNCTIFMDEMDLEPAPIAKHRIDLKPGNGYEVIFYNNQVVGKSFQPLYASARWLLANRIARENHIMVAYRKDMPKISGVVGFLAHRTVVEATGLGGQALSPTRWSPYPGVPIVSKTPEDVEQAHSRRLRRKLKKLIYEQV